jgi:4-oxalocrotonate tautomerase
LEEVRMPYVNVQIAADGNTAEQKLRVIEGITAVLVNELGKDPNGIFIVIDEVHTDNWGWKGTSVTKVRQAEAKAKATPARKAAAKLQKAPIKRGASRKA